jgi:hypothetical protein
MVLMWWLLDYSPCTIIACSVTPSCQYCSLRYVFTLESAAMCAFVVLLG